jgi:PDZ domain
MGLASTAAGVLAFATLGISCAASAAPAQTAAFQDGASSTGWIDFDFQDGKRIFIPAKINGHDTVVLLATGLPIPDIDKTFAASIGLPLKQNPTPPVTNGKTPDAIPGLQIQIGNLTLPNTTASVVDFAPLASHIGHLLPFLLGDDAFADLVVDIDFAHHRIAFRPPASQSRPAGAVEVPLVRAEHEHLVPVSIEGAPPAEFELGLGNSGEMLVYQSYYEPHKLSEGRRTSKRLAAGTGGFIPETVATLRTAEFAGVTFANMPAAFIPASAAGTSNAISGDIGLPVLARFRLIIDYPHDRLYALPYAGAMQAPLAKDRLGLTLHKDDAGFAVQFVAPNSPAQAAGFKVGDKVTRIDGKSAQAWPDTLVADLRYGASGTSLLFTMQGGDVRQVKLADYF